MALKTLRQLIRERPTGEELAKIRDELRTVHDRSAAILATALVEDALEDLLLAKLQPLSKTERLELFEGEGPLGSFSAKIKLAHALSLISSRSRADLMLIKEIRNVFAHASGMITFETPEVVAACTNLKGIDNILAEELDLPPERTWPPIHSRDRFVTASGIMALSYEWKAEDMKREQQEITDGTELPPSP